MVVEFDAPNGLYKISPILDWSHDDIWAYIRANKIPGNRGEFYIANNVGAMQEDDDQNGKNDHGGDEASAVLPARVD